MNALEIQKVLALVQDAHKQVEDLYLKDPAGKSDPAWLQKRRLLLADLSLHLVQAALTGEELNLSRLKRALFSVLTIARDYLPEANLDEVAERLAPAPETN
jgi:hypothetical protein